MLVKLNNRKQRNLRNLADRQNSHKKQNKFHLQLSHKLERNSNLKVQSLKQLYQLK